MDGNPEISEEDQRLYPLPEFVPVKETKITALREDNDGNCWLFIDLWFSHIHSVSSSAKLRVTGKVIEVAVRTRWMDHDPPPVPAGEWQVLRRREWENLTGLAIPQIWRQTDKMGYYAIKLPFYPEEVKLVDRL